jgi:transcriptional regulator with XRE-family HTH domain
VLGGAAQMTFNYSKLRGRIREVFGTQDRFAEAMGRSNTSISQKLNNKSEWTQKEINRAVEVLGIDDVDISAYFFCSESLES